MHQSKLHILIFFILSGLGVLGTDIFLEELSFLLNLRPPVVHFIVTLLFFSILPYLFYKMQMREVQALREVERTKAEAADQINRTLVENVRLSAVADKINSLVMITDNIGKILWVNASFERHTGYSLSEVIGRRPNFLHGPNTDLGVQDKINNEIREADFVRAEIINYTKAGDEYWVELNISAIYDNEGRVNQYISISNIITERKRNEAIIEKQKEAFRQVAWANSHSIRRPVASILSLARLSEECVQADEMREIHTLLKLSANELDEELKKISKDINKLESDIGTLGE